ncbi:DUF166 domain-containing protein [Methanococcus aeolicus]|uniref:Thymidylate synthase n=1 Tax=Methanococcus aeolicus (strain ATCC BAA-1280 / DSM 17508 / OCM 812 / Nankai-3) TaxID=419665 RepID=A6UTI2_META3|nr:DUF166 domain-containing protein [Methanococcus aeolicus]ABR55804.1 Protein of unknown function DUF166 [Methanococcus aeolicus Nankai-3]UXM84092.1 DUF166 domain-containing protein [Methanococcus aeolicus]
MNSNKTRENSLNILIISEGKYGERAVKIIGDKFNCDFMKLNYLGDFEDIEIDKNQLKEIEKYDIVITYILNPDLTYYLLKELSNKPLFTIVGAWAGEGFKKQLENFGNVICPNLMCDFNEEDLKNKLNKYPQLKEFLKYFGAPKINLHIKDNKIDGVEILRGAPCGSTNETMKEFIGKEYSEKTIIDIGLRVQHYCRAGKLRIFVEKEGKKSKAGKCLVNGINVI